MEQDQKTNFFTLLATLLDGGLDLTLTIRKQEEKLVVGVRPQRTDVKRSTDKTEQALQIRPMVLTHPASDLDESFFTTITEPIKTFNTTADEIKAFNDELTKQKEEATKKRATATSTAKKKAPVKKSAPAKKAPAPAKPKLTPEEIQKKKDEAIALKEQKAQDEKLADIKAYLDAGLDKVVNNPQAGLEEFKKGIKKADGLAYAKELGDQLLAEKDKAETAIKMKEAEPLAVMAEAKYKNLNFGECGDLLKKVFALVPNHPKGMEIRAELITKLGEGFVKKLLNEE